MEFETENFSNIKLRETLSAAVAADTWDFFVTASLHKDANIYTARSALKDWHRMLDRRLLGGRYSRMTDKRTFFWAFIEGGETNLHWHMTVKLRCEKHSIFEDVAKKAWAAVAPSGTLDVQAMEQATQARACGYATKALYTDEAIENFVVSTEFETQH